MTQQSKSGWTSSWWSHQMETFSALLAICAGNSPVPGEFPTQRPVTRSFDVYFDLRLNKRLCKQSWGWWFETLLCPLWRHGNGSTRLLICGLCLIDLLHKSHNAPVPYPTMPHFVTEMCTHVHISVTKWCIMGYLSNALWDLWDGSIECFERVLPFLLQIVNIMSKYRMGSVRILLSWKPAISSFSEWMRECPLMSELPVC